MNIQVSNVLHSYWGLITSKLALFHLLCSDKHTVSDYEEPDDEQFSAERVSLISERRPIESRVRKRHLTNLNLNILATHFVIVFESKDRIRVLRLSFMSSL